MWFSIFAGVLSSNPDGCQHSGAPSLPICASGRAVCSRIERLLRCRISTRFMTGPGHSRHSRYTGVSGSPQEGRHSAEEKSPNPDLM
jgi:hypothetical protein